MSATVEWRHTEAGTYEAFLGEHHVGRVIPAFDGEKTARWTLWLNREVVDFSPINVERNVLTAKDALIASLEAWLRKAGLK